MGKIVDMSSMILLSLMLSLPSSGVAFLQPPKPSSPIGRRSASRRVHRHGLVSRRRMEPTASYLTSSKDLIPDEISATATSLADVFPSSKLLMASRSNSKRRRQQTEQEDEQRDQLDQIYLLMAVAPSLLAFLLWEDVSRSLSVFLDTYGTTGRAVDGGQFAVNLLRPTITGVVVPVISIALATLVSTTVNVLRARQVELRALVNKESCELRLLRRAVRGMFGTRQHAHRRAVALALVCAYVEQLERETRVGAVESLEELQLSGGIAVNELDRLSEMLHGIHGAAASRQGSVGAADDLVLSLTGHRSDRVALLLSVFPVIHWGVLVALSVSLCVTFLLNSNQMVLQYLNSVQLRTLFAILVGVFSGTAMLCLDLADPFRGSFSISEAATQLEDLRLELRRDIAEACAEAGEISAIHKLLLLAEKDGSGIASIESLLSNNRYYSMESSRRQDGTMDVNVKVDDSSPRRYGLFSTVYFHLLTGPLGSNVRLIGDVVAWVTTFVSSRFRLLSQRIRNKMPWRRSNSTQRSNLDNELELSTPKVD